jgi:hypothetical protein
MEISLMPDSAGKDARPTPDSAARPPGDSPKPRRRFRRLLWVMAAMLIGAIGFVVLLPTIVSMDWARRQVLSAANPRVRGSLAVDSWKLGWFSPCTLTGVRVDDPAEREVLRIASVRYGGGLWQAIRQWDRLRDLLIVEPVTTLYVAEDGSVSLAEALSSPGAAPTAEPVRSETLDLSAGVEIRDAAVRAVFADGAENEITDLDARVELVTTGPLTVELSGKVDGRGTLEGNVELRDWMTAGRFDAAAASGTVKLTADRAVDLAVVDRFARTGMGLGGLVTLRLDGEFAKGKVSGEWVASADGLRAAAGDREVRPVDVELSGQLRLADGVWHASTKLAGAFGMLDAGGSYDPARPWPANIAESLLAVWTEGSTGRDGPLRFPNMTVEATSRLDLAALAQAVPSLLHVREGLRFTRGELVIDQLALAGGDQPSVAVRTRVSDLTALDDGREIRAEPFAVAIEAGLTEAEGVALRQAQLKTGFGNVTASGSPQEMTAQLTADLDQLNAQLGRMFDFNLDGLAGRLAGRVALARQADDQIAVDVTATVAGLRYVAEGRRVQAERAEIAHRGSLALQAGRIVKIQADETRVDLDGKVQATGRGWYAPASATFESDVTVQQADLAYAATSARRLGITVEPAPVGVLRGSVVARRAQPQAALTTSGTLTGQNLRFGGPNTIPSAVVQWQDAAYTADTGAVAVESLDVRSDAVELTARKVAGNLQGTGAFGGDVNLLADIAKLGKTLADAGVLAQDPGLGGRLTVAGNVRTRDRDVAMTGRADVVGLTAPGDAAWQPRNVQVNYDARVDTRKQSLDITRLDVDSEIATARLRGTIEDLARRQSVNVNGSYRVAWADVLPVIYALAPNLREQLTVTGVSAGDVRLRGDLSPVGGGSPLQALTAQTEAAWDSAEIIGVAIGEARVQPTLREGQLTIPNTATSIAGGTVRLGGSVDMRPATPILRIPGQTRLLEHVRITPEMANQMLSRFNPLFGKATRVGGTADLIVRDLELPLGAAIDRGGSGGGVLKLDKFQIAPGGVLAELLALGQVAREIYTVDVSGLNFAVKEGRIHYRDLRMSFAEDQFDLVFYGSVGFDDSIDLVVSVPVGERVLEKVGVRGSSGLNYAKLLTGLRVDVPLVGTRQNPRLDFSQVNVKSLLDQAIRKQGEDVVTGGGLLDILGGIAGDKQEDTGSGDRDGAATKRKRQTAEERAKRGADDERKPRVRRRSDARDDDDGKRKPRRRRRD